MAMPGDHEGEAVDMDVNSALRKLVEDAKFSVQVDEWMASEESDPACEAVGEVEALYVDSVTVSSSKLLGPMLDNASRSMPAGRAGLTLLECGDGSVVVFKLEKLHEYSSREWRSIVDADEIDEVMSSLLGQDQEHDGGSDAGRRGGGQGNERR